ncbi:MAG: hypothetical protein JNM27_20350 [Leptospirales bacterium]|nr:hypothetical protein [Leptospirales bacterium]
MKKFLTVSFLSFLVVQSIYGQAVFTKLKDPEQIRTFTAVSEGLICGCGCHLVLSTCPHVDCPWGIPARRFIENRIREGMNRDQILEGMVKGFGEGARNDAIVQSLFEGGRDDLANKFITGFGPEVRAKNTGFSTILVVTLFGILAIGLASYWLRKRARAASVSVPGKKAELDSVLERTRDLDK